METTALRTPAAAPARRVSVIERMANRFGVDADKMLITLKQTAFKAKDGVTNEQMMALLVVAEQYNLNPWTKEIFAFPDKNNGIVPVIGVDGWSRIINSDPQFDGMEFAYGPAGAKHKGAPEWVECSMYRKDRSKPTIVREHMAECFREVGPWQSHPARMLRHKAMIQCARVAFGFVGVYDEDEAQRIVEGESTRLTEAPAAIAKFNEGIKAPIAGESTREIESAVGEAFATAAAAQVAAADVIASAGPALTVERLQKMLEDAKDVDVLDVHADLIGSIADEHHRERLTKLYKTRKGALKGE